MRPFHNTYDDIDEIDGLGYDNAGAIRQMIDEMLRQDQEIADHKRSRYARQDSWRIEHPKHYGDHTTDRYVDYDEDEFDQFSGIDIEHHGCGSPLR